MVMPRPGHSSNRTSRKGGLSTYFPADEASRPLRCELSGALLPRTYLPYF